MSHLLHCGPSWLGVSLRLKLQAACWGRAAALFPFSHVFGGKTEWPQLSFSDMEDDTERP